MARQRAVGRTAHAVHGPDHPGVEGKGVEQRHHLAFVRYRDVESAQVGRTGQQPLQRADVRQFIQRIGAVRNPFPFEFGGEIGSRSRVPQRASDQSVTTHGLLLPFFHDDTRRQLDAVDREKPHDAEHDGLAQQGVLLRKGFETPPALRCAQRAA